MCVLSPSIVLFLLLCTTFLGVIATSEVWKWKKKACLNVNRLYSTAEPQQSKITASNVLTNTWWVSTPFCAGLQLDKLAPTNAPFLLPCHSFCLTAHISSSFNVEFWGQFGKLSSVKQRETTRCLPSLCFLLRKCWNSCNDSVVGSVKIEFKKKEKERLLDLENIIHGCGSEEHSYDGLWQVYRSKHIPATLELGAACLPQTLLALWTGRTAAHHILGKEQGNHGNISETWGLFWRLAQVWSEIWVLFLVRSIKYLSYPSNTTDTKQKYLFMQDAILVHFWHFVFNKQLEKWRKKV